jgi:hypothetical protein
VSFYSCISKNCYLKWKSIVLKRHHFIHSIHLTSVQLLVIFYNSWGISPVIFYNSWGISPRDGVSINKLTDPYNLMALLIKTIVSVLNVCILITSILIRLASLPMIMLVSTFKTSIILLIYDHMTLGIKRACHGHDRTVVGFITAYAINVYYH